MADYANANPPYLLLARYWGAMFCCDGLQNLVDNAGQRGMSVLVYENLGKNVLILIFSHAQSRKKTPRHFFPKNPSHFQLTAISTFQSTLASSFVRFAGQRCKR